MKKGKLLLTLFLLVAVSISAFITYRILHSPEYTLKQTVCDVQARGIEGLKPHLTEKARGKVEFVAGCSKNKYLVGLIQDIWESEVVCNEIQKKRSTIEWSIGEVRKSNHSANIAIDISFDAVFSGQLEIEMKNINGEWKIDAASISQINYCSETAS